MATIDIIRAWKDESYRASLSADERAAMPENPAGPVELTDMDLGAVAGGNAVWTETPVSFCYCNSKSICSLCDCP
jgi:mersacidin/lichenicidin family type 2 lantibiotic